MDYRTTLLMSGIVTHDVKRFVTSRPDEFQFTPGEGVQLAIDQPQWRGEPRPFTPTSLVSDRVLEFTIKSYPQHEGVTRELHRLEPGAQLLMSQSFGTIRHRGPGTFIAGGAGITPFLAIVRELARKESLEGYRLIFANKTPADIICEKELRHYFGDRCRLICSEAGAPAYEQRRIDEAYLRATIEDVGQRFYVCGPPGFMETVTGALNRLGVDQQAVVFEQ